MEEDSSNEPSKSEKKIILKGKSKKRKRSSSSYKSQNSDANAISSKNISSSDDIAVLKLDEAFEITKGNQCSQWAYGLTLSFCYSLCGIFAYSIPFLDKYPDFECKSSINPEWYTCSREDVCENNGETLGFTYRYNTSSAYTISNWITSMSLECIPEYKIGLFGSLYFVGFCIGAATLLRLADIRGRKPVLLFSLATNILVTFLFLITNDLFVTYVLIVLNGIVIAPRASISYLYMMEVIQENKKKLFNFITCLFDALTVVSVASFYYFYKVGEATFYFYLIHGVVTLIALFSIPESPQYLYAKNRFFELKDCFQNYAKMNSTAALGNNCKFDKELKEIKNVTEDHSLKALVSDKSRLINIIIMIFNWSVCSFCYYVISFFVQYFKGDIYTNGVTMGIADALAVACVRIGQIYISTKKGFIISYFSVFSFTLLYMLVQNVQMLVPICILFMRLGITIAGCNNTILLSLMDKI